VGESIYLVMWFSMRLFFHLPSLILDASCAGVHLSPVSTDISQDDAENINTSGTTTNSSGET
jgi:hypothetical protein